VPNQPLELPKSIILLRHEDQIAQDQLACERQPFLVEGYSVKVLDEPPFTYRALVNCHNSRFWTVLSKLFRLVTGPVDFSIGEYGKPGSAMRHFSVAQLSLTLGKYSELLASDTEIEMLFDSAEQPLQLYVSDCKYFELYGSDEAKLRQSMLDCGVSEIPRLATIDEFPRIMTGQPLETSQSTSEAIRTELANSYQ
jgi:hypothetical protein